jgi:glycine/D-amino acid oxidase-like deaminating enzyme
VNGTADIVIAGAGVIGMSIALQLARRSRARVLVLDRAATPGEGSTGASSAVCRYKYSRSETVMLARDGIEAYHRWRDFVELADPLARFHRLGVLWLGDGRSDWPSEEAERLAGLGVRAEVIDDDGLRSRYPAVNPCAGAPDPAAEDEHRCGGGARHLLELDGGYIEPVDVLNDLIRSARERGVEVRFRTEVEGLELRSGRVAGVRLADGGSIDCRTVVSAGGPWCTKLFARIGLEHPWQLEPTRIQVVHLDRPEEVEGPLPVACDLAGGIYFRPQNGGQQVILGSVLEEDEREVVEDPDTYANWADDDFIRNKLYFLEHRIRGLGRIGRPRAYSGLYTINRTDFHPIVGPTPIEGFIVANGFSGHGFKLAPAIGSLVAQLLAGNADSFDTAVDPAFLAFDRQPIRLTSRGVLA